MPIVTQPTATLDQENFFSASLAQNINASATTIYLDQVPTLVTEGYLVISRKSSTLREVIYFTAVDNVLKTVTCPATGGRGVAGTAQAHTAGESCAMTNNAEYFEALKKGYSFLDGVINHRRNLLKNGNFHNVQTNGYGKTPEDWTDDGNALPVQGGFPVFTKQNLIDLLGILDGDIEALYNLNGNFTDLSTNGYNLSTTGTPANTGDALMAQAKDFERGTPDYASIADASCPALEISGSQTWIAFVKCESINDMGVVAKNNAAVKQLAVLSSGVVQFRLDGLTTATSISSDVVLDAAKYAMIVGVYDSANTKLKVWVNGIKKETTASGSATDTNGVFYVGSNGGDHFDGIIQNAMVLSVALTDAQVKRLWAATTFKGQKIRRSGTNGYLYQDLPENLVERLRGRKLTLRASMYQDVASIGTISIDDGSETETSTTATANAWTDQKVTKTISATATRIRVKLKVSTTNGNVWFKEVSLYEGAIVLPYEPSLDDWARFPGLLQQNPFGMNGHSFEGRSMDIVKLCRTTTQSINDSSQTTVTWDAERFKSDPALHSLSANTSRITIQKSGFYRVYAQIAWAANTTGRRYLTIIKNGAAIDTDLSDNRALTSAGEGRGSISTTLWLVAGDYIEVQVLQNSGGALNVQLYSYFGAERIG